MCVCVCVRACVCVCVRTRVRGWGWWPRVRGSESRLSAVCPGLCCWWACLCRPLPSPPPSPPLAGGLGAADVGARACAPDTAWKGRESQGHQPPLPLAGRLHAGTSRPPSSASVSSSADWAS